MRRALLTLAGAMLVACSSADAPTEPSRSPPAEAATSPSPSASSDGVQELAGSAPLEAGRVRSSAFEPPFTFAVPEGWEGGHAHADYFDVWNGADVVVGFGRPSAIPGPDGRIDTRTLTPRDALRAVAGIVDDPSPITETAIDGLPALEMSFSVDRRTGVLRFGAGTLHIEPPWRQRMIALEVDAALVVLLLQTTRPGDAALDTPVLSSIEFEP